MQIDANSAVDRVQLIRTQLTAAQGLQFSAKALASTDGRALTDSASAPVKLTDFVSTPVKVTDFASVRSKKISDARENLSGTRAIPTPGPTIQRATDLGSLAPSKADSSAVTDGQPAAPVDRVDALLADWGQSDSAYDLDKNGIVGVNDLLMLLAQLDGGRPQQPQEPHGDVAADPSQTKVTAADPGTISDSPHPDPEPTTRLEALLADWGESDSPYDLDKNGIVGVSDLLLLLAQMSDGGSQQPREPHGDVAADPTRTSVTVAEPPAQPNTPHDPPVAPGKRVAIGVHTATIAQQAIDILDQNNDGTIARPEVDGSTRTFDRLDRNHDGALSRSELASQIRDMLLDHLAKSPNANLGQFLQEAMKLLSDHNKSDETHSKRNPAVDRSSGVYRQANLGATARQFVHGLTDQGAMELRKFVQEGGLSANEKRTVLDQISLLRPGAQSVNLVS